MTDVRADLAHMPRYRCHKVVSALKVSRVDRVLVSTPPTPEIWRQRLHFERPGFEPLILSESFEARNKPEAGGYFVVYQDGYMSYSPAAAFEEGYTEIKDPPVVDSSQPTE